MSDEKWILVLGIISLVFAVTFLAEVSYPSRCPNELDFGFFLAIILTSIGLIALGLSALREYEQEKDKQKGEKKT